MIIMYTVNVYHVRNRDNYVWKYLTLDSHKGLSYCLTSLVAQNGAAGSQPQSDFAQGGQTYVIQHPWPGTEGPLTIKKQGVEQKKVEPKKELAADEVVVA